MLIIKGNETKKYQSYMEDAYRLRHKIFVEELGWEDIRQADGREIDQFDYDNALHMLIHEHEELVGYQRLLPTTQPHLLSELYPQLCEEDLPCSDQTWEWTRFAVRKDFRKGGRKLSRIGNMLLSGIVEWGLENNVNSIVIEMNPVWLLRLVQLKFRVYPLGFTHMIGSAETLAVKAHFGPHTLKRLQEFRGDNEAIITNNSRKFSANLR